jgi:hypothetical protein
MGADMADVNNDGKADIFVTDMLPESDVWKTTILRTMIYFFENKSGFFNQYMQNTLQINNGITSLWKLLLCWCC